jgi:putative redox protein
MIDSSTASSSGAQQGAAAPPKRPANHVLVDWRGDLRFEAEAPNGTRVLIDAGGESAPGPVDTLLGALAACAASDVVLILGKQRTPPSSLQIEVVATRVNGTPRRLDRALLIFHLAGEGIEREAAERAIELSITKYCSVRESLNQAATIEWRLDLGGAQGAVHRG